MCHRGKDEIPSPPSQESKPSPSLSHCYFSHSCAGRQEHWTSKSGGEAHEQRPHSPRSHLTGEVRKGLCFQSASALCGGGLEQELFLSGEVITSTAPDPSPKDRISYPSTAIAPSLSCWEPLLSIWTNSALRAGLGAVPLHLTLLTLSWFGISLRLQNPAQHGTSDLGNFPTPGASTSCSIMLPPASSSVAEHAGAAGRLNLSQDLREALNFCAAS